MDGRNEKLAAKNNKEDSGNRLYADLDQDRDRALSLAKLAAEKPHHTANPGDIPPYLLEQLKNNGDKSIDESSRQIRAIIDQGNASSLVPHLTVQGRGDREVYDAKGGFAQPGNKARFEGEGPSGIPDADQVYEQLGLIRKFYKEEFNRDSIDGQGMKYVATVNYGENVQNAFWDSKQMWFGKPGPNSPFKTFVLTDVIGHEITHGVTEAETQLWQWQQAGALHEHFSDVFGEMIDQYAMNQKAEDADWLHGAGAFKDGFKGRAVRDMLNPGTAYDDPKLGKDPQRAHMKDIYEGWNDNGGVHINSGIPNRAFALFAKSVGGYSWKEPGHIWWDARKAAGNNPNFAEFAYETIEQAKLLKRPDLIDKLEKAWDAVGVLPTAPKKPAPTTKEIPDTQLKKAG